MDSMGEVLYEFRFSSDKKFLALKIGLSRKLFLPVVWCMCAKEYRTKGMLTEWNNYPREATSSLLQEPYTSANCLVDPLHCLLRTSDLIEYSLRKS